MSDKYENIRAFSRPYYEDLPSMTRRDRAAQFSSFAALAGYEAAVCETARITEARRELCEDEINELNSSLCRLRESLSESPSVTLVYFVQDERKAGGRYALKNGTVRIIDEYENTLVFTDGERISVNDLYMLRVGKQ